MSVETDRSSTDFEDTALTLTLHLPSSSSSSPDPDRKRASSDADPEHSPLAAAVSFDSPQAPKAQVVGWTPVRSFRKHALIAKFVKVAVDGAPYLRKVDLQAYAGYDQRLCALQDKFFSHFTTYHVI